MGMKPITEAELERRIQGCIDRLDELHKQMAAATSEKERKKIDLSIDMEREFMEILGATPTIESVE